MEHTAKIRVFGPCDCENCAQDGPWFSCLSPDHIATYDCAAVDYDTAVPHPAHIAWVREQHPGTTLVYLDT